ILCFASVCSSTYIHSFPTRRSSDLGLEHVDHVFQRVRLRIARLGVNVPADIESVAARVDAKGVGAHAIRNAVQLARAGRMVIARSEEHTSELQSRFDLVCRLLLEKK